MDKGNLSGKGATRNGRKGIKIWAETAGRDEEL